MHVRVQKWGNSLAVLIPVRPLSGKSGNGAPVRSNPGEPRGSELMVDSHDLTREESK